MPFGMMSGLGPTNTVLCGVTILDGRRGKGNLAKNVPDKPNTASNCDFGYKGPISLRFRGLGLLIYRKVGHHSILPRDAAMLARSWES